MNTITAGLMTRAAAADYLGIAKGTLANWQSTGFRKLPFLKLGRHIRYRQHDLDAWIETNVQNRVEGAA